MTPNEILFCTYDEFLCFKWLLIFFLSCFNKENKKDYWFSSCIFLIDCWIDGPHTVIPSAWYANNKCTKMASTVTPVLIPKVCLAGTTTPPPPPAVLVIEILCWNSMCDLKMSLLPENLDTQNWPVMKWSYLVGKYNRENLLSWAKPFVQILQQLLSSSYFAN